MGNYFLDTQYYPAMVTLEFMIEAIILKKQGQTVYSSEANE